MKVTVFGEVPNLRLLVRELRERPELDGQELTITKAPAGNDSKLRNADWASIVVDLGVGLVSAAVYETAKTAVKAAVQRAKRRGQVETRGLEDDGPANPE
ncbi:hypothetical protein [Lentzea nigeriaca]|uniref:hypothetical protein n=1 Tax=Lentzea nigeriaca TaxID=1128665 RepID=UPI00195C3313|nr:hypothetical protein [Lentzea nigeriaca]MBM7864264.1 hypothetical protein [Lentzea nigeriaca]